jgi:RNA polymerase sigma-70 factor (ECF subfamily)
VNGQEDESLVKSFKKGDEGAFDRIFEKYHLSIYSICYRYTRNEADARDLTQEVFIRVYRNLPKFRMRSKLFTWLYRITVNTCLSFKRRECHFDPLPAALPNGHSLDREVILKKAIDDALRKLPERQRMTFVLRHYEGYTFNEIGAIMGISSGAAKANHYHAVRKLRTLLESWL